MRKVILQQLQGKLKVNCWQIGRPDIWQLGTKASQPATARLLAT